MLLSCGYVERAMGSLAQLPDLVGFFSYSREDDEDSKGKLSALRGAIGSELALHLGRSRRKDFQLWQDQAAIAAGDDWESEIANAIGQAAFFIPIVTPRAVASKHCQFEFESFLARERELSRDDLIFPILYVSVPALEDEAKWRNDPLLSIVGKRQHCDWRRFRHVAPETTIYGEAVESFCKQIVAKLREPWVTPEERRELEAERRGRTEEEHLRQQAETERQAEDRERVRKALLDPRFPWRTIKGVAADANVSADVATIHLRADPEVRFSKSKTGKVIAGLISRVGTTRRKQK
jgi:hypothetical protein